MRRVYMSLSKRFYFSIVVAALYLSSNSVSTRRGEGGFVSKKRTGLDGGRGVENWQKIVGIFYGCPLPISLHSLRQGNVTVIKFQFTSLECTVGAEVPFTGLLTSKAPNKSEFPRPAVRFVF